MVRGTVRVRVKVRPRLMFRVRAYVAVFRVGVTVEARYKIRIMYSSRDLFRVVELLEDLGFRI